MRALSQLKPGAEIAHSQRAIMLRQIVARKAPAQRAS